MVFQQRLALQNEMGISYDGTCLETNRLYLRFTQYSDCAQWMDVRSQNYKDLQFWEPVWGMDHLTYHGFLNTIQGIKAGFEKGDYYLFSLIYKDTDRLVGQIEISNVLGWPLNQATIGYWLCKTMRRRGLMDEALDPALEWIIKNLYVARIEAITRLDNTPSQALLKKKGFEMEGIKRDPIEINNQRLPHYLFSLLASHKN